MCSSFSFRIASLRRTWRIWLFLCPFFFSFSSQKKAFRGLLAKVPSSLGCQNLTPLENKLECLGHHKPFSEALISVDMQQGDIQHTLVTWARYNGSRLRWSGSSCIRTRHRGPLFLVFTDANKKIMVGLFVVWLRLPRVSVKSDYRAESFKRKFSTIFFWWQNALKGIEKIIRGIKNLMLG